MWRCHGEGWLGEAHYGVETGCRVHWSLQVGRLRRSSSDSDPALVCVQTGSERRSAADPASTAAADVAERKEELKLKKIENVSSPAEPPSLLLC